MPKHSREHSLGNHTISIHTIEATLAQLQQSTDALPAAQQAVLQGQIAQLASQCQQLRNRIADDVYDLTGHDSGLQGLMSLLELAESRPLPACELAGLLSPLLQKVRHSVSGLCEVL